MTPSVAEFSIPFYLDSQSANEDGITLGFKNPGDPYERRCF